MKHLSLLATTAGWLLLLGAPLTAQNGYRVIVNASNPVTSLSKAQISKLYLQSGAWDNGVAAAPVDLPVSDVRDQFSRDVLGMPATLVSERWQKMSAGGGVTPPPMMATDREVLAFVRLKPGAIGYVSLGADVQGVKVVNVGGRAEASAGPGMTPLLVQGSAVPERVHHVQPHYPAFAKSAKVQGTVTVEVVVGPSGNVEQARVVRSIPALDDSAVAAVRQWRYKPTIVNGVAVPITMLVHVAFGL